MEDSRRSEDQLLSEKLLDKELKRRNSLGSLKTSLKGKCIVCGRKVRGRADHQRRNKGQEDNKQSEESPEVAVMSVVSSPGFLRTFNGIWRILINKNGGLRCGSGDDDDGISLETMLTEELGSKATFSEAPTFCERCCDKVVAVENLMKAVRRQVREIKMLWEESKRKGDGVTLKNFEYKLDGPSEVDCGADVEVKQEEQEEWHWQESAGDQEDQDQDSSLKSDPGAVRDADGMEMECEEDSANRLEDQDEGAADDEDDDSNWGWDDDDPDYIKSEQEDSNDPEEDEELISEEELDEDPLTLVVESQDIRTILSSDPLEIISSMKTPHKSIKSVGPSPGPSPKQISCDVKGCTRKFIKASKLLTHKRKCHTGGNLNAATSSSFHPNKFTCDLESCTRTMPTKESLYKHKWSCHTKLMIDLEKLDPQNKLACSCGRRFPNQKARYTHQRKNKATHPDFQFKLKESRKELIGGQLCDFCGEPVKLSSILEHLASHLGGDEYVVKCPNFNECGHAFTHSKDFQGRHRLSRFSNCKKICEEEKFGLRCETCGYTTDQKIRLPTHVANEHERGTLPKNLKCPISGCEKMFAVKQSIYFHLHVHRIRRITSQNCDKCGKDIKVEEMEVHLKEEHGIEEIFGCGQCPLKFSGRDELVEHVWEHRDAGLSCDLCGDDKPVKYLKYSDFRDHYFGAHQLCPKRYKCEDCENRWFWRNSELNKHKLDNHKQKEAPSSSSISVDKKKKMFECDICNVSYKSDPILISHKIRVHGADPFTCDICGEKFHEKAKFTRHIKEHAGMSFQKEWKCEVEGCGKVFKKKHSWKHHLEMRHEGQRRHVCEICGKGYSDAGCLKTHRNTVHLGLRPWVCDVCGERFTNTGVLKRHRLIHTGERPFGCDICGQRFRHKEVLERHQVGHEEKGAGFKPNGPMKQIRKRKAESNC